MLKNKDIIQALILSVALLCNSAAPQELDIPEAFYPELPKYAATAQGFVPHGWTLEVQKFGDLNGDGRPDLLLVLHENNPKNIIDYEASWRSPLDTNPRILAVAFAKPGGGYALAMQNHTIIQRHVNDSLSDVMEDGEVSIVRGNLLVRTHFFATAGSWRMGSTSYTFRYQHGGFELIGYDTDFIHRASLEIEKISINYLTNRIKITTGNEANDNHKIQWKKLASLTPIPIAAIDGDTFHPDLTGSIEMIDH